MKKGESEREASTGDLTAHVLSMIDASWHNCGVTLKEAGYTGRYSIIPDLDIADQAEQFATGAVKGASDALGHRIVLVRELIVTLAMVRGFLESPLYAHFDDEDESGFITKLIYLGMRIGSLSATEEIYSFEYFSRMIADRLKLQKITEAPKNRKTPWVEEFAPVAVSFCKGKATVSYGQLCAKARAWAAENNSHHARATIPASDTALTAGIKKLEKSGRLVRPPAKASRTP